MDAADQSGGPPSESGGPPCGDDGPPFGGPPSAPPPGNPLSGPPPASPHRPSMSQMMMMMMRMSLESLCDVGDGEIPQTQTQTGVWRLIQGLQ